MKHPTILALASFLSGASAHTIFTQLQSGGTLNPVSYGIRDPSYDGPITDVTTNDLACNGGPNPTTASPYVIDVKAGDTVQATWRHTLTSTAANDAVYVIDPSHLGPVMAYMKKVSNATTDVGYGSGWFKISQAGLNVATQDWATTDLIANTGIQNIQIPSCIENGQYLLRAEVIALHAASSYPGAQLYMECAQINVSGGTGTGTPSTVSLPGAYSGTDPGILINIYQTLTTYQIPGPTPFVCGTSQASSSAASSSVKASSTATTLATSTKTSSSSAAASATGAAAPLYGQCGGIGWTGATTCASGTCTASSVYYSQCLP
ncbi:related to endoglucanase B [Phialocephala subalpina]|uniref:AA9 family lytic polysaccharide monooxygenase n=1 Tax=Phialocephala subalpina TaxID=576137 RepID=A0A1L7WSS6_9HELO|nr:related to endoglucanase B [Phialocephala subalpina]